MRDEKNEAGGSIRRPCAPAEETLVAAAERTIRRMNAGANQGRAGAMRPAGASQSSREPAGRPARSNRGSASGRWSAGVGVIVSGALVTVAVAGTDSRVDNTG